MFSYICNSYWGGYCNRYCSGYHNVHYSGHCGDTVLYNVTHAALEIQLVSVKYKKKPVDQKLICISSSKTPVRRKVSRFGKNDVLTGGDGSCLGGL